jgi:hypothetical protein
VCEVLAWLWKIDPDQATRKVADLIAEWDEL